MVTQQRRFGTDRKAACKARLQAASEKPVGWLSRADQLFNLG
jgi:hypothetical protein